MTSKALKQVSKSLSYVLRHRPDEIGLVLGPGGWVEIETLLAAFQQSGTTYTRALIEQVVAESDKKRFEISDDGECIRARQGHSVEIDLGYEPAVPPDALFHGTATRNLESIFEKGLLRGKRHHVHMSTNKETMLATGMRHGKPVLIAIDARQMHAAGHTFFVTGNQVWLTEHVPPQYLTVSE